MLHLHFAIDDICSQFKRFLISVIMVSICLILLILTVMFHSGLNYAYNSVDMILSNGVKGTGIVTIDVESNRENIEKFINDVYQMKEISSIGQVGDGDFLVIEELYNIQKENTKGYFAIGDESGKNYVSTIEIDKKAIKLCDFNLSVGNKPEQLNFDIDEDEKINEIYYLYLGSAYSSIDMGTEYVVEYLGGEWCVKYIVAGLMEKEQKWIDPRVITNFTIGSLDYAIDCTYGILVVGNSVRNTDKYIFDVEEDYSIDETMNKLENMSKKYNIKIDIMSLEQSYEIENENYILILSYISDTFMIVIPAIILMLITTQVVSIMLEMNSYGVLYSVGFFAKDINIILIIKNIILGLISIAISTPVVFWFADKWFVQDIKEIMKTVLFTSALPVAIIVLMVVICVTSITAVLVIKRYKPTELMRMRN